MLGKGSTIGVYAYFPESGLLGSGSDWAAVPDEFKGWSQRGTAAGVAPVRGVKK